MVRVLMVTLLVVAGCKKKADEPPPKPFTGPLTVDRVMGAKKLVNVFDPWDAAFARLQAQLGAPQKQDAKAVKWAVVEGETCAYVVFNYGDGKQYSKEGVIVDGVQEPMKVDKSGPIGNRADCLEIAGKAGPPEDPNAPGPPADGHAITSAEFAANALAGRSKWEGKRVKVAGEIKSIGGIAVSIGEPSVSCNAKTPPDASVLGKQATTEGTVKIQTWMSGAGEPKQVAELDDCVVTVEAAGSGSAGSGAAGSGSAKKP